MSLVGGLSALCSNTNLWRLHKARKVLSIKYTSNNSTDMLALNLTASLSALFDIPSLPRVSLSPSYIPLIPPVNVSGDCCPAYPLEEITPEQFSGGNQDI